MQNVEWGNVLSSAQTETVSTCVLLHAAQTLLPQELEVPSSLVQDRLLHSNGQAKTPNTKPQNTIT